MSDTPGSRKAKLLVIVGPTASGKSALAVKLAKILHGEIVCADSQTVKKSINTGTAKPTLKEQGGIIHHLLDVISPYDKFTAARFKKLANNAIYDIQKRKKLPILVGGTGLYVDSVIFDFDFRKENSKYIREDLASKSIVELQELIRLEEYPMPSNKMNPRHLIRTLESGGSISMNTDMKDDLLIVGINPGKEILKERIEKRVKKMVASGFTDEVRKVIDEYGMPPSGLDAIGYKIVLDNINDRGVGDGGKLSEELVKLHWQYARRQMSWFRRNKNIIWFSDSDQAYNYILKELQ